MTTETLPRTAPAEPTTPIKPSEAIRLGCLLAPRQAFGVIGHGRRACVMGAMARGFGGDKLAALQRVHDVARTLGTDCPACDYDPAVEMGLVVTAHLNDDHRWSRERIADWLEGLGL